MRKLKAIRSVRVEEPAPPKPRPKLPPYRRHQEVTFTEPGRGTFRGKVVGVNDKEDVYKVELRSGVKYDVEGSWIKTRRPEA